MKIHLKRRGKERKNNGKEINIGEVLFDCFHFLDIQSATTSPLKSSNPFLINLDTLSRTIYGTIFGSKRCALQ